MVSLKVAGTTLPDLARLAIENIAPTHDEPSFKPPGISQRRPLGLILLRRIPGEVSTTVVNCQLTSRSLSLAPYDKGTLQLITPSSETMVELILLGMWFLRTFGEG